jgi:hypothetical protein
MDFGQGMIDAQDLVYDFYFFSGVMLGAAIFWAGWLVNRAIKRRPYTKQELLES